MSTQVGYLSAKVETAGKVRWHHAAMRELVSDALKNGEWHVALGAARKLKEYYGGVGRSGDEYQMARVIALAKSAIAQGMQ